MTRKYWIALTSDIWEFQKLAFFLQNIEDLIGIDQDFEIHAGLILGEDLGPAPGLGLEGPLLRAGDAAVLFSSSQSNFRDLAESFGLESPVVDLGSVAPLHLAPGDEGVRWPGNAARMSLPAFREHLRRTDPWLDGFASGRVKAHLNAPVMSLADTDTAVFYDPAGDAVELPMGRVSLPLLRSQIRILSGLADETPNPHARGMVLGVCRLLGEIASGRAEG